MRRIGIFSGTFDPIHVGHVEACLVAKGALELDEVQVMIEKKPHHKTAVTDYQHRQKMVELALSDFSSIKLFDTKNDNITFDNSSQQLQKQFPDCQFVMIVGSDMLEPMQGWPGFDGWITSQSIAIVLRDNKQEEAVKKHISKLAEQYATARISILPAVWSTVSSSRVRSTIKKFGFSEAVHQKVGRYITQHHLYQ